MREVSETGDDSIFAPSRLLTSDEAETGVKCPHNCVWQAILIFTSNTMEINTVCVEEEDSEDGGVVGCIANLFF